VGLQDRVLVLPARDDVPELLAAIDLVVHPALAESFGLVVLEALAMARPIVSTPVGIAPDLLSDGRVGLLAADGTPENLEGALREALARRGDWAAMAEEGRRRARRFAAARMVRRYEEHYLAWLDRESA
jgi:glycosyltransferase involved in cell wall biosynthesis